MQSRRALERSESPIKGSLSEELSKRRRTARVRITRMDNNMSDAGNPLIEIENLTKVFYTDEVETHALAGVHLMVRKGEYVAMSGPSGCGKSTLLSIIGLLDTPTAGDYKLNGAAGGESGFRRSVAYS